MSVVVTTIQQPTPAMQQFAGLITETGGIMIIVGDEKGPNAYPLKGAELLSLDMQERMPFKLPKLLPTGHYSRKNTGYLLAMSRGANCIYETDDDNAPLPSWVGRKRSVRVRQIGQPGWVNAYKAFTDAHIWPRGYPLSSILLPDGIGPQNETLVEVKAPIQQGLVDGSPDVDAVWRLVCDRSFRFERSSSVALQPYSWCPFNSQSTWWWSECYALMYLPSTCSFRLTDIWRGLVAQRCLWELGYGLVFHAPEVVQERNPHDLMKDFRDELPGYYDNDSIVSMLADLQLEPGEDAVGHNLSTCWKSMCDLGHVDQAELDLVEAWLKDIQMVMSDHCAGA